MTTPPNPVERDPSSQEPGPSRPERREPLDRRYLTGCVAGLLLGGALGVPGAYALLRVSGGDAAVPCVEDPRRDKLDAMLAAGLRALGQKDATRALGIFRRMEKATPGDAKVHNNICAALNDLGRYSEAVAACKDALAIDPGFTLAKNNLAWARAQRERASPSPSDLAPRAGP